MHLTEKQYKAFRLFDLCQILNQSPDIKSWAQMATATDEEFMQALVWYEAYKNMNGKFVLKQYGDAVAADILKNYGVSHNFTVTITKRNKKTEKEENEPRYQPELAAFALIHIHSMRYLTGFDAYVYTKGEELIIVKDDDFQSAFGEFFPSAGAITKHLNAIKSAVKQRSFISYLDLFDEPGRKIRVKNGTLDLNNGGFNEQDRRESFFIRPFNYLTNERLLEETEKVLDLYEKAGLKRMLYWDQFCERVFVDKEYKYQPAKQVLFEQFAGFVLSNDRYDSMDKQKFLFLDGEGGSGRSTVVNVLLKLLPDRAIASWTIETAHERFGLNDLIYKLVNANLEENKNVLSPKQINVLKKMTGNDTVTVEAKGKDHITFVNRAKFIIGTNNITEVYDDSPAFMRRLIFIRMPIKFRDEHKHLYIKDVERLIQDNERDIVGSRFLQAYMEMVDAGCGFNIADGSDNADLDDLKDEAMLERRFWSERCELNEAELRAAFEERRSAASGALSHEDVVTELRFFMDQNQVRATNSNYKIMLGFKQIYLNEAGRILGRKLNDLLRTFEPGGKRKLRYYFGLRIKDRKNSI